MKTKVLVTPWQHKSNMVMASWKAGGSKGLWGKGFGKGGRWGVEENENLKLDAADRQKGTEVGKQADEPGSSQLHCFTLQKISICTSSTIKPNNVFDTGLFGWVDAGLPAIRSIISSRSRSPMEHSSRGWGAGGSAPHWGGSDRT